MNPHSTSFRFAGRCILVLLVIVLGWGGADAQEPAAAVRGRVLAQDENGRYLGPLVGAKVEFLSDAGAIAGGVTTEAGGFYQVSGLAPGLYRYRVSAEGYATEDAGRGIELPATEEGHVFDFILSRGTAPTAPFGAIEGQVTLAGKGAAGALVSARRVSGGGILTAICDDDGGYRLELAADEWRVSARVPGFPAQVHAGSVTVVGGSPTRVDFALSSSEVSDAPMAKEVLALVSVPADKAAAAEIVPKVSFVEIATGATTAAKVARVTGEELGKLGVGAGLSGAFEWYQAEPATSLPAGEYRAEASREGFPTALSEPEVAQVSGTTWLDVAMVAVGRGDDILTDSQSAVPGVRGRILGQSEDGRYLGPVAGARVEFLASSGEPGGSATADATGFYEIPDLGPGVWTYRIAAEGFASENSGRGIELAASGGVQVIDFILSQGNAAPLATGLIRGQVTRSSGGVATPMEGAMVTLQRAGSEGRGAVTMLETDAEGNYQLSVPAAEWRASALSSAFKASVHPTAINVGPGSEVVVDFEFSESDRIEVPVFKEVFALVSVERGGEVLDGSKLPVVEFVAVTGGKRIQGTVRPLDEAELSAMGIATGPGTIRFWDWFEATPGEALPLGDYFSEASLTGYTKDISPVKTIAGEGFTWYDLALALPQSLSDLTMTEPDRPVPSGPGAVRVHGRVTGQTDEGKYEGVVPGARVELYDERGGIVAAANANDAGYYEVAGLRAGGYLYRVAGAPYLEENAGRGFILPADSESYELDFLLSRPGATGADKKDTLPGILSGRVWLDDGTGRIPVPFARVTNMKTAGGGRGEGFTDAEGRFRFVLPVSEWRVAATIPGFASQVHPRSIATRSGGEEEIEFVFAKGQEMMPPSAEILLFARVERLPGEAGDVPSFTLKAVGHGEDQEEAVELKVEPLGADPRGSELFRRLSLETGELPEGDWQWYAASPATGGARPGNYAAAASLEGYTQPEALEKSAFASYPAVFEFELERIRPELEVTVVDKERAAIPGAALRFVNRTLGRSLSEAESSNTDAQGKATMMLRDGRGDYNIMASAEGYDPQVAELSLDGTRQTLTIRLFRTGEMRTVDLTGTVIEQTDGAAGAPVSGASLVFEPGEGQSLPAGLSTPLSTDAQGAFAVADLPEGPYQVLIKASGYKDWAGPLAATFGMEPVRLAIEKRNVELENWTRLILTEGWGKRNESADFHARGLVADATDCRLEYAAGLSMMRAQDWTNSGKLFAAAATKSDEAFWLDRIAEGRVWLLMHREEALAASAEIRRVVAAEYAKRAEPTEASLETISLFGCAMGVLNGPWSGAKGPSFSAIDEEILASLTGPHRDAYLRARDGVTSTFRSLSDASSATKQQIVDAAEARRMQMEATVGRRLQEIQREINEAFAAEQALDQNFQTVQAQVQVQVNDINVRIQQNAAQFAQAQAAMQRLSAGSVCEVCRRNGATPGCQACAQLQRTKEARIIQLNRQLAPFQAADQQLRAQLTTVLNQLRQAEAQYRTQKRTLSARSKDLDREKSQLAGQMAAAPDPSAGVAAEEEKSGAKIRAFITYRTYPLERRRDEILQWLTDYQIPPAGRQGGGEPSR